MLNLHYQNNRFEISFNLDDYDFDMFNDVIILLKRLYVKFDSVNKIWWCKDNQIEDVLAWLEKHNFVLIPSDDALRHLNKINNTYFRELEIDRSATFLPEVFRPHIIPFKYQIEGMNKMIKRSVTGLNDGAGLGKSMQAIGVFSTWYLTNKIDSVLLVVRNGLSYQWKSEILEFSSLFKEEDIALIDNNKKIKLFDKYKDKKIIIIPAHLVGDIFASYRNDYSTSLKLSNLDWSDSYVDIKRVWGKNSPCLVIDESHSVQNPKAVITKAVFAHLKHFKYRLYMTATPNVNDFCTWWTTLRMIDKSLIKMSFNAFRVWISKDIGNKYDMYSVQSYNPQRLKEIQDIINLNTIRRIKEDLPEMKTARLEKAIKLEMPPLQRQLYLEFIGREIAKIEEEFDNVTLRMIEQKFPYLSQVIDNPDLIKGKVEEPSFNSLLSRWKIEEDARFQYLTYALADYIDNLKEKVVIFDSHPLTLDTLAKKFSKYKPLIIHGALRDTPEEKDRKIRLFNDKNSEHKILFLSSLMSAGLNLNKGSRRAIFWSLPNDNVAFTQSIDRVYRINNTQDALIEYLLLDNSIDMIRYHKNIKRAFLNSNFLDMELTNENLLNYFNGVV